MKIGTIQSALATNAANIRYTQADIAVAKFDAALQSELGEKAFAIEVDKRVHALRKQLAKRVRLQNELKQAAAEINTLARIRAKGVRLFGKEEEAELAKVQITSVEIEAVLDEALAIKFPKKADTRPADHPSFGVRTA